MTFPIQTMRNKIVFSSGTTTLAAGATRYFVCIEHQGEQGGNIHPTESYAMNYLVTRAGVIRNLVVKAATAPGVGEGFIYAVRVNGVNTTLQLSLIGAAVDNSDLVNSAQVNIGDIISVMVIASAAAAVSTHIVDIVLDMNMIRLAYDHVAFATSSASIAAGLTRYLPSCFKYSAGSTTIPTVETDTRANFLVVSKGTMKNFVVSTSGATGLGESFTYNVRVNGITIVTLTISGAVQRLATNTTVIVMVNPSDRVTIETITSAAASARYHAFAFDFEEGELRGES